MRVNVEDGGMVRIICDTQEEIDFKNSHGQEITAVVSRYFSDPWTSELKATMEEELAKLMGGAE
jgi:hypothetical protein